MRSTDPTTSDRTPAPPPCLAAAGDAVLLRLAVVPNARRTEVEGLHDGALRVRLAAPPVDGRANEALLGWLSGQLSLPRRAFTLRHGAASRRKTVAVDAPAELVVRWLDRVLGAA